MSQQFTVAQLEAQKTVAQQNLASGKLSASNYQTWVTAQDSLIVQAKAREAQSVPSPLPPQPGTSMYNTQGTWQNKTPTVQQTPVQKPELNPLGFIEALANNPVGTIGAILNPIATIEAKDTTPVGTVINVGIGAAGEALNQYSDAGKILSGETSLVVAPKPLVNVIPNPKAPTVAYTPQSETQKTGQTAFRIGEAVTVAAVAPVFAPAIGMGAGSVVVGEVVSVGINQGFKVAGGGGLLTPEEIAVGAAEGGVFSLVGGKLISGVGLDGVKGVSGAAGRVGVNAGLGGVLGAVSEQVQTGKSSGVGFVEGAAFGGAFGLAGELSGLGMEKLNTRYDVSGRVQRNVPLIKYGDVSVPVEIPNGEKVIDVNWKGLYVSKGTEAAPIVGRYTNGKVTPNFNIVSDYVPISNIESAITQNVMVKAGYSKESIGAVRDVRFVMRTTQDVRPEIDDVFPIKTSTLSEKGTSTVKDYIMTNKDNVEMVYGSYAARPQMSKVFEYTQNGKSALRVPGDIDVQLNVGKPEAEVFASKLVSQLRSKGENVRISKENSTLIEAEVHPGEYAHAVDIHFKGEVPADGLTPSIGGEKRWGFTLHKQPVIIEELPAMALGEQGLRKGSQILRFQKDQGLGTQDWRSKDAPDFFQSQRTLLESKMQKHPEQTVEAFNAFTRAQQFFGVSESDIGVAGSSKSFVYQMNSSPSRSAPSMFGVVPSYFAVYGMKELGSKSAPYQSMDASVSLPTKSYSRNSYYNRAFDYSMPSFNAPSYPSSNPLKPSSPSSSSYNPYPSSSSPSLPSYNPYPSPPSPKPYYPGYNPYPSPKLYPPGYNPYTSDSGYSKLNYPLGNSPGTGAFDRGSFGKKTRSKKFLWEFPVMEPNQAVKGWF